MTLLAAENLVRLVGASGAIAELPEASGVAFNSAAVRRGDIFFALQGGSRHGIDFADDALARGAAYIVSDRPHPRALLVPDAAAAMLTLGAAARAAITGAVVGVTGSVGKTTVKNMLAAVLAARATEGNMNTHFALVRTLVDAALHQPERPLVLELGVDRPGEMAELLALTRPEHGLVTTIAESHLSALGDVAGVAREKSALLSAAPGLKLVGSGAAAHLTPELLARCSLVTVETSSGGSGGSTGLGQVAAQLAHAPAELIRGHYQASGCGSAMLLAFGESITLPWPGRAMAENALLALATALRLGVSSREAITRLLAARLEPRRLQLLPREGLTVLDDSYNSNPTSALEALEVLRGCAAPRVAFLGDMLELGDLAAEQHERVGRATRGLDLVVGVGTASESLRAGNPDVRLAPDTVAAEAFLAQLPRGATVLIKGSLSMHMERLVAALLELHPERDDAQSPEGSVGQRSKRSVA